MQLSTLTKVLLNSETGIRRREWPDKIFTPSEKVGGFMGLGGKSIFWEKVLKLREFTDRGSAGFSENYEGSTGWEYHFQLISYDGKLVYTAPKGSMDYNSVHPDELKFSSDYKFDPKNKILVDKFYINDSQVYSRVYSGEKQLKERNRIVESGQFKYGRIGVFHSHPLIKLGGANKPIYTFFSTPDISYLMGKYTNGKPLTHMLGLVSDRLWVLGLTVEATIPSQQELGEVTRAEALDPEGFPGKAADLMSRHEFVLYNANFGDTSLVRVA